MLKPDEIKDLQLKIAENSDSHAFSQLYMAQFHNLQKFANSIIKNQKLAEEIVSDVFIKVWQKRANFVKIDNFKLYLYYKWI